MDRVKLKKIISNYYMERLTLDQCADEVLELFNVVELKQECTEKKSTLPDEWSMWCRKGDEHTFNETVIKYLNNKYREGWHGFADRYYGERYINGEYRIGISNIPFGRELTFAEFQSMVIQESESSELKPSELIKMSKSNNTYPYQTKYILCKEKGLGNNT